MIFHIETGIFSALSSSQKHTPDYEEELCATAYVGIAMRDTTIKSVLASGEESNYDATLCERIPEGTYEENSLLALICRCGHAVSQLSL